jgi:hypothetical protein
MLTSTIQPKVKESPGDSGRELEGVIGSGRAAKRTLAGEAASSWTDQGGGCARHLWPVHVENFGMLACYVEYPVSVIFYS